MVMVDYEFYENVYYGEKVADGKKFKRLRGEAVRLLDYYTFDRINLDLEEDVKDMVKFTICKLIDYYSDVEKRKASVSSESLGDFSISYNETNIRSDREHLYEIIKVNLVSTGLLYRGVR